MTSSTAKMTLNRMLHTPRPSLYPGLIRSCSIASVMVFSRMKKMIVLWNTSDTMIARNHFRHPGMLFSSSCPPTPTASSFPSKASRTWMTFSYPLAARS